MVNAMHGKAATPSALPKLIVTMMLKNKLAPIIVNILSRSFDYCDQQQSVGAVACVDMMQSGRIADSF